MNGSHVKGNFAALKAGEAILFYDFQSQGDKDFVRKLADEFGLKFSDKPKTRTAWITKE